MVMYIDVKMYSVIFFFFFTILSWLLLPELMSFSLCRNGRKNPQPNRLEQRVQKEPKLKGLLRQMLQAGRGRGCVQFPAGSAPLTHHPPLVPASLLSEAEMALGTSGSWSKTIFSVPCQKHHWTTIDFKSIRVILCKRKENDWNYSSSGVHSMWWMFHKLEKRPKKEFRRALKTTIFILKHLDSRL